MNSTPINPAVSRRQFLKTSTAAAVAAHLSFPEKQFAANSDTLRVGLAGCGGRGTDAAVQRPAALMLGTQMLGIGFLAELMISLNIRAGQGYDVVETTSAAPLTEVNR